MLTVVMPAFKTNEFIGDAIKSVLEQDDVDHLIVVDDCCPNHTGDKAARLFDDPRLTVLRMHENGGQYRAINTGVQWAFDNLNATMIAVHDSDDIATPDRYRRSVFELDNDPHLQIVSGQLQHIDVHGQLLPENTGATYREDPAWTLKDSHRVVMNIACATFRRDVFDVLGGFDPIWGGADTQFFMRAFYAGLKMKFLQYPLAYYRQHDGQVSKNLQMDPVRKAYHQRSKGEWTFWKLLQKQGRLRPYHLKTVRIIGDADVLVTVR